jgi:AMP nucleosidase
MVSELSGEGKPMMTKEEIARDWLPRYTGTSLEEFSKYILLTNFSTYLCDFAKSTNVYGLDKPMQTAKVDGITMVNFGIGSPNAALICDLLAAIDPKAVLFLGKCGGLQDGKREVRIGDFVLPTAAIRGEGTSAHYFPAEVPALPSFQIQKVVSFVITEHQQTYHSGSVYTTDRRLWEHDDEFRNYLKQVRCTAIDMETAAFFLAGFANHIPHGALLLVSDLPLLLPKTEASDTEVSINFGQTHLKIGIEAMQSIMNTGKSVRYWRYEG